MSKVDVIEVQGIVRETYPNACLLYTSKPGLRVHVRKDEIPMVLNGLGIAIISTSSGVMTDAEARKNSVGGEVLAYIW